MSENRDFFKDNIFTNCTIIGAKGGTGDDGAALAVFLDNVIQPGDPLERRIGSDSTGVALKGEAAEKVAAILREEIELAKPDNLPFFESQVEYIADRIVRCLTRTPA